MQDIDLQLFEHQSSSYAPRTYENAKLADLTVAIAADLTTAGERCTMNAAGNAYVSVMYIWDVERAVRHIVRGMRVHKAANLNIAGNGIYTLKKHKITQEDANVKVYEILKGVHAICPIESIRSGGQTGIDIAGLVAGCALGIPSKGVFPRNYRQRNANKVDHDNEPNAIRLAIETWVDQLLNLPDQGRDIYV